MATYKGIQGYSVQKLATDPTASEAAGQLWYNSTTGKFKVGTSGAGAWASGTSFTTAREYLAASGITTAAIVTGGDAPPGDDGLTETYNGTTWTEVNNLTDARYQLTAACQAPSTAALVAGGREPAVSNSAEEWDGTSWTEATNLTTARALSGMAGIQTAAIMFGGYTGSPAASTVTDKAVVWNGSTWTETADLLVGRSGMYHAGTSTAALGIGGTTGAAPAVTATVESWNGTSWTETTNINTARQDGASGGSQTAALIFGGLTGSVVTESWDGSSWTTAGSLAQGRHATSGTTGTSNSSGFAAGGYNPSATALNTMEIWTDPVYAIKTVTVS